MPETPAEELRAAATRLRETAAKATRGPWVFYQTITRTDGNEYAWTVCRPLCETDGGPACDSDCGANVLTTGAEDCEEDNVNVEDVRWMALVHPGLAEPLAEWLEHEAYMAEKRGLSVEGNTFHAMKVARAINGGAS